MKSITTAALLLIATTASFAAPKIEGISNKPGAGIPKTTRFAADGTYDSYSFRFNTGSDPETYGSFLTVRANHKSGSRFMNISLTPGDFTALNGSSMCTSGRFTQDVSVRWTVSPKESVGYAKCLLEPNTDYYLNVRPYTVCNARTKDNCSFSLSGSSAIRSPNYKHTSYYKKRTSGM